MTRPHTAVVPDGEIWAAVDGAYTESKGLKLELDAADNIV